jgi:hypothetical protein
MYGNVKIKKFPGGNTPGPPLQGKGEGERGEKGKGGGEGDRKGKVLSSPL